MLLEAASVFGSVLSPANGVEEARGSEVIGAEHVFDEDADGAFELVQGVVESNNGAVDEERREEVEIELCAPVGVVAVDPEEADGAIPADCYFARVGAMSFHAGLQSGGLDGGLEVVEGGAGGGEVGVGLSGLVVRVDADDGAEIVGFGDGGDANGGLAFEAADFDGDSARWGGCSEHAKGAEFAVAYVAFYVFCFIPGSGGDGFEIGWKQV